MRALRWQSRSRRARRNLPLLGQIPIDPRIQEGGDTGRPIVAAEPEARAAKAIEQVAQRVMERMAARQG